MSIKLHVICVLFITLEFFYFFYTALDFIDFGQQYLRYLFFNMICFCKLTLQIQSNFYEFSEPGAGNSNN